MQKLIFCHWEGENGATSRMPDMQKNKAAAEQRLREVMSAITEGRYIQKSPDAQTRFKDLAAWYLELPEVKAKRSYDRDKRSLKLLVPFFGDRLLKDIKPGFVEAYRQGV
jgi:hypothetical protein